MMKKLNDLFVMFKEAGILFLITLIAGLFAGCGAQRSVGQKPV